VASRLFGSLLAAVVIVVIGPPPPARGSHPIPTPTVVQQNLTIPWDLDFAPDGTMFVTERWGRISVYASGQPNAFLLNTTIVPIVRAEHESGLNGIAVDVDFAANPFIYVCAARDADGTGSAAPWLNEVLRYQVMPDRTLANAEVIFTGAAAAFQHNGCSVEMDASGKLWLGIGDGAVAARAQDPDSLNGKILRINRDGSIPADNPIMPGNHEPSAVYSMGHRNPQGIAFEPGTGQVWAAEHGPSVDDEINRILPGANYGWPCYTGAGNPFIPSGCGPASAYSNPAWTSGAATIATSGMTFLDHPLWEAWAGTAVVGQLKEQDLRRFTLTNGGTTMTQADLFFDGQFGRLRAAVLAPDGALYVTTSNGTNDRILRVVPGAVVVDRFAGPDRYATAAATSAATFPPGVPVAYVATGRNFPDALAGGPAAARDRGPVLLVTGGGIPAVTAAELQRLRPQRIVVLGGTGVITQAVQNQLATFAPGGASRLAGADRFATAAAISGATFAAGVPVAYVATGLAFPDALSGGPAAGREGGPILLVTPTAIPASTAAELERLDPQRIVVLGGTGAVSAQVAIDLQRYTPSGIVRRSGADRYATAVAVSQGSFPDGARHVFVATGQNFPDGLAGGPAAALRGGPLLLVPGTSIPPAVRAELLRLDPDRVTILGGTGVVTDAVQAQIHALLNP
jgi:glucose/arabinose dehydrogenase